MRENSRQGFSSYPSGETIQYVANILKAKGYTVNVDNIADAVRTMIESAGAAAPEVNEYIK